MKLRILVFIFLSPLGNIISGQTNFQPGFIITNEFDTIRGLVDYRGDIRNSQICVFKNDSSTEPSIYSPKDIKGYRIVDGKFYVSRIISKDSTEINLFLEYLVNGIADLYYYRDNNGDHYLVEKEGGKLVVLTNEKIKVYGEYESYLRNSNRYIGILKATFSDCNDIMPQINKVRFTHNDLIKITSDYHEYVCEDDDEECIIYQKELPLTKLSYGPILGFNYSNLRFVNTELYSGFDFKSDFSLSGGILLNILSPRINEKISFQIETVMIKNYFYAFHKVEDGFDIEYTDIHIHVSSLNSLLSLKYTFPKSKIKPFLSVGFALDFVIDSDNCRIVEKEDESTVFQYEFNDIPLSDLFWGTQMGIGISYNRGNSRTFFLQGFYEYIQGRYSETILGKNNKLGIKIGMYFTD